ncbi:pyridoxamine 5'-phosphate oxidase family protein, partial [Streptomyces fagopyri]|uniref:pyridoxamine 5'-phosphate oxidase family protein n=1 Tax=Streptomyces fagopyri TaxID=2662397 RepID=UPI00369F84CE
MFAGPLADFDPEQVPAEPVELFLDWLRAPVAAGVPDAHAMTLSTVAEDDGPDARVLLLENVDSTGWQFAAHAGSPKGRQLPERPRAALTFHWPPRGRQVRLRGTVDPAEQGAPDPRGMEAWPVSAELQRDPCGDRLLPVRMAVVGIQGPVTVQRVARRHTPPATDRCTAGQGLNRPPGRCPPTRRPQPTASVRHPPGPMAP